MDGENDRGGFILLHSMLLFGSIWYTTAHKVKENNEVGAGETLKVGHGNE